ncbi:uncharacterized protein [Antedon mediterranea]|uniref:uncharacterized protein n=1 Tax=Antedon mediterranea TaxID=105859 RepID=UPI003AF6F272
MSESDFDEEFLDSMSIEVVAQLSEERLRLLGTRVGASINDTMNKYDLINVIGNHVGLITHESVKTAGNEVELARIELEREKLIFERRKIEMQTQREMEKEKHEFELKKLELANQMGHTTRVSTPNDSEITQNIKWVPKFNEDEVETYFLAFEKIANRLKWPARHWTVFLQTALVGKAQEVFSALADDQCESYDAVKTAVLSTYELVPEAYRQKFRNLGKPYDQTFTEFARKKQILFDRWCSSEREKGEFGKLRELMLVEEFKSCSPTEVRTHLEEQKVDDLRKAASVADNYVLTHKVVDTKSVSKSVDDSKVQSQKTTVNSSSKFVRTCFYCKKKGHIKADCWLFQCKSKGDNKKPQSLPNTLVNTVPLKVTASHDVDECEKLIQSSGPEKVRKLFKPFLSTGSVALINDVNLSKVRVLRDTGASQSLIIESAFGDFVVGVVPSLPVWGVTLLLGNDLAGDRVTVEPVVCKSPVEDENTVCLEKELSHVFPSCAVTRSMANKTIDEDESIDLCDSFYGEITDRVSQEAVCSGPKSHTAQAEQQHPKVCDFGPTVLNWSRLVEEQSNDPDLVSFGQQALSVEEMSIVPVCYYIKDGILMRKWRPPDIPSSDVWNEIHQIVIPSGYRQDIIGIAHDDPLSGHLGVNKTVDKILRHFFWSGLRKDVSNYCKSCHACQVVGKPNQKVPVAPLKPIPAFGEPFSRVIVDCVGPLPRTKNGNEYLLTIMCASSRFPEAIPLRRITAKNVVKALVKFFTWVGLPKAVQSDQG